MKKILVLFLILFCFCTRQKDSDIAEIDVLRAPKKEIGNLSEIADDINFIALETTDSSLIGRIITFKVRGNYFYVATMEDILCFSKSGKFVFKFSKKGRGPGEYNYIGDFDVSPENNLLAVSFSSKIFLYEKTVNGYSFLNDVTLSYSLQNINFVGSDNNILVQYSNVDGTKPFSMELINIKGERLASWPNYMGFKLKDGMGVVSLWENISFFKDGDIYRKELQNDTLFRLTGENKLDPFLVFNTGKKRLTPEARSDGNYYSEHLNEYFILRKIFCSDKFLYYSFNFKKRHSYKIIYNLETKRSFEIPQKEGLIDDIAGGVSFDPQYGNEGDFYMWVDPITLKSYVSSEAFINSNVNNPQKKSELKKLADSISEFDNPVLVIANVR